MKKKVFIMKIIFLCKMKEDVARIIGHTMERYDIFFWHKKKVIKISAVICS